MEKRMNTVGIVGRVATEPESKTTAHDREVCTFRIAVQRTTDAADFFTVVAWERQAELVAKLSKGENVGIKGRLQNREWKTDSDEKRQVTEIVCERVTFIGGNPADKNDSTPVAVASDEFVPA